MSWTGISPGFSLGSLSSSVSAYPAPGAWGGALADWGIPFSCSQFSVGFAPNLRRWTSCPGLVFEVLGGVRRGCVLGVATCDRLDLQPELLRGLACGEGLKLKEINHLQHTTGATHYSALPQLAWGVFLAFIS